jgi:hypothetical protein
VSRDVSCPETMFSIGKTAREAVILITSLGVRRAFARRDHGHLWSQPYAQHHGLKPLHISSFAPTDMHKRSGMISLEASLVVNENVLVSQKRKSSGIWHATVNLLIQTLCSAIAGSPLQCWDNSTRGLDSATALEFVRTLRTSTELTRATAILTLYQASQSIYDVSLSLAE